MRTLLIAYGNPSRGDDGLAFHVVRRLYALLGLEIEELADGELLPGLYTLFAQQLQPGHVKAIAGMQIVIFIDAHIAESGWPPVHWQEVFPQESRPASSHHQAPETLLALAEQLYGCSPGAFMLSVQGDNFEFGEALTCAARERAETAAMLLASKLGLIK